MSTAVIGQRAPGNLLTTVLALGLVLGIGLLLATCASDDQQQKQFEKDVKDPNFPIAPELMRSR